MMRQRDRQLPSRPPRGRARAAWVVLLALAALLATAAPPRAEAQWFGQNKVQYKKFNWKVLRTQHFDIYHYTGTEAAVQDAALMAERAYDRLSRVLHHDIRERVPLVLYASHSDFEQTNITPELISLGTGGITEYLKRRVFLPFTGDFAEFDHVLTHELVHAFQVDILFGDRGGLVSNPFANAPPGWFMEGMAEYLSVGEIDTNTQMWLRDASLEGYLIPIGVLSYVGDLRVYRFGQSIWQFIADTYGIEKIGEILKRTKRMGSAERALEASTGLTVDVLSKKWQEAVRKQYLPQIADSDKPDVIASKLTDSEHDLSDFNVAPAVSPSGLQMVFISDRSMYNDVYLASALDGKVFKKLVSGERTGTYETLRYFDSSIAWAPDEKEIALPVKSGPEDAIYVIGIPSGKIERKLRFGLDAIYSPAWSPDGKRIAFVGLKNGMSALYVAGADGKDLRELAGGPYSYRDPAWSPDGGTIAFTTDRGAGTEPERLIFGKLRLALYDMTTGEVRVLPKQSGSSFSPQWTPDGKSLVFVSDRSGTPNIYRLDLATADSYRLSNLLNGVSGLVPNAPCISLSPDGKRLLFTAFTRGGWDIYSVREPRKFINAPVTMILADQDLAPGAIGSLAPLGTQEASSGLMPSVLAAAPPDEAPAAPPDEAPAAPADSVATSGGDAPADSAAADSASGGAATSAALRVRAATPADSSGAVIDTTLGTYIREVYREPLADSTSFVRLPYKAKFSRDYVSGGALFASNIGFAGSSVISFSDVLGNRNILAVLNLYGDLSQSDIYLAYSNLAHRTNWGLAVFQYRNDLLLLSAPSSDNVESQIYRGGSIFFARPFNRFRRFEYGITSAVISERVLQYNYDLGTISTLQNNGDFFYVAPNIGLVADNTLYNSTGPINGGRSRYSLEHAIGDVHYTTGILDWRRYTNIRHRYALAQRLIAGGSWGRDPQLFRFGGAFTYRGADYGDLVGTRALIGNLEFRFPLIEQLRLGWPLSLGLGGFNGVMFLDGATAWEKGTDPVFFSTAGGLHTENLHLAWGFGARVNLGYFILRYDYGREFKLNGGVGRPQNFVTFGADF
ncbi:MAG: basic secretory protein-like protein [Hyphomicrobiales bacterium]